MVAIGIRNEDLAEALATYKLDYLLNPFCIELVEDVVKKKQRCGMGSCTAQEIELR